MAQYVATEENIKASSTSILLKRYDKISKMLQKGLHPVVKSELLTEKELIYQTLKSRNETIYIHEQLDMGLIPERAEYASIVIDMLRRYYVDKRRIRDIQGKLEKGFEIVFPNITSSINESGVFGSNGEFKSKTEQAIVKLEEKKEKWNQELVELIESTVRMEQALDSLNETERSFIEKKYLVAREPKDEEIIPQLFIGKTYFYEKLKPTALSKLAEHLGILKVKV